MAYLTNTYHSLLPGHRPCSLRSICIKPQPVRSQKLSSLSSRFAVRNHDQVTRNRDAATVSTNFGKKSQQATRQRLAHRVSSTNLIPPMEQLSSGYGRLDRAAFETALQPEREHWPAARVRPLVWTWGWGQSTRIWIDNMRSAPWLGVSQPGIRLRSLAPAAGPHRCPLFTPLKLIPTSLRCPLYHLVDEPY